MEDFGDIVEGISHMWNNKFTEAEKIFDTKRETSPRHALHYAEVAFLRSFITADTSDTETAISRLKDAKKLAETHIKSYEKGVGPTGAPVADKKALANSALECRVVFGDTLYMLAVLQLTRDTKLKGALNMRKSWKVFEDALKLVKDCKDKDTYNEELVRCLNFGAGFFLFAMSILPGNVLKVVEFIGFRADREQGLQYLHDCHNAGGIRAPFATIVLLFNNLLLPRGLLNPAKYLREADSLIKESLIKYPEGSLLQVMGSHCARKQCDIDGGIKYMEDAIENCKTLNASPLIYKYELANCFVMKLNWAEAVKHFEPLVAAEKFQVRSLCALQLGTCQHMMGDTAKANVTFAAVATYPKKTSVDPIVARQAARFIANGGWFAALELLYIRRDLAKMERAVPELLELLEKQASHTNALKPVTVDVNPKKGLAGIAKSFSGLGLGKSKKDEVIDYSIDDRAVYLMLKGSLLKSANKIDEAIECFREVIRLDSVIREKYYVPYSMFELGEILYHKGNLKEAQEMMKKCNNISGYDWEDPLKVRLRVTIDQLKKGGALDIDEEEGAGPSIPATPTPEVAVAN